MAIKPLLADENEVIRAPAQWEARRANIRARLFDTIGIPPVTRSTRSIQILSEEKLDEAWVKSMQPFWKS